MKTKVILFISILLSSYLYPQFILKEIDNNIILVKYSRTPDVFAESWDGNFKKLDFIEALDESKPGFPKLPTKVFFIAIPPESKIEVELLDKYQVKLDNVLVEANPLVEMNSDSTLNYLKVDFDNSLSEYENYPESFIEVAGYTWVRDYYVAAIRINPYQYSFSKRSLIMLDSCVIKITFNNNSTFLPAINSTPSLYDDVLKNVIINYEQAQNFKSTRTDLLNVDTTGNWIDFSKEYLKLAIPADNIYRITYNNLISFGVNPDLINPKTIKLFVRGKEQPIYVEGEEDNVFNQNDFIEFYAERNYTYQNYRNIVQLGQDYIQYLNRYTDTTIVWLTWDGNFGRRVSIMNANPVSTSDTIKSHLAKIHLEQDVRLWYYDPVAARVQLPFWQENKTFTWLFVGNSGFQSVNFNARDFIPNTPVSIIARLISYASNIISNAHRNGLSLNNTNPTDTVVYNYRQTVNFSRIYNSNQLITGNNVVRIFGLPSSASFHQSLVDWVDIDYFRRNVMVNDTIKIIVPDTVQVALRNIRIENITSTNDLIIYKIFPTFKKITNFSFSGSGPFVINFIDTVGGRDQYYITRVSKTRTPIFRSKKFFTNVRNNSIGADYIIISNKILQSSSEQYKNFISSSYNVRTVLIYNDDIFDEFAYGFPVAESIRDFLKYAYANWPQPRPSFLLLIGDANYDYKDIITPAPTPRKKNILTSFGNPVSDPWYVMWDSANVHFPQMFVGRIPANNDTEVTRYLQKHQNYLSRRYDIFNKSFIFFSGGDATKPSELQLIREANIFVMNSYITSAPIFGNATHFYKTINPPSNFGPYTLEQVQRVIDEGGLFISYIGHSGTRTWDNSITEVEHIKNKYNNRHPLISDFGCSTGKFAEPDVDAFGELFVAQSPNGQAIAYLGNSSWGYLSTSLRFPRYFYRALIQDSIKGFGYAHTISKIRQLNETGTSDINRVFTYCNLLLGDPIIGLKLPEKPNLFINSASVKILTEQPNDQLDSIKFRILLQNYGIVNSDSISVLLQDFNQDTLVFSSQLNLPFPKFIDTLLISIPVNGIAGSKKLKVYLDSQNLIDEIYEDDNQIIYEYIVNSTALSTIEISNSFNTSKNYIDVISPFVKRQNVNEKFILELSRFKNFNTSTKYSYQFDTLYTRVMLNELIPNQRYYYRTKTDDLISYWSQPKSFIQGFSEYQFYLDSNEEEEKNFNYSQTYYDSLSKSWKLSTQTINLKILSAGGHDGAFGSIQYNGYEQLPNTYYWGLVTAIIDTMTLRPTSIRYFNVPDPGVSDSLTNYINRQPQGTIMAITISADAVQNILGSSNSPSRNAIKTLGSRYIDSVVYREGWCILGKKGAPIGSVPEDYKKLFQGVAQIEISKSVTYDSGYVVFPEIKYARNWNYVKFHSQVPIGAAITYIPIGIRQNGQMDTLYNFASNHDSISISSINAEIYPSIKILAKLYSNQLKQSPSIFSLAANYESLPELALNYQTVRVSKDTIYQGERISIDADIYNIGKSSADSVKVVLELIDANNEHYILLDTIFTSILPYQKVNIKHKGLNTINDLYGNFYFKLKVDPNNTIREFFENNNTFISPFFVKRDTLTSISKTSVWLRFNNREIFDWDYVEPNSEIDVEINYPVWFSIEDTSAVQIFINGIRIYSRELNFDYDTIERKMNLRYSANFNPGDHNIRVFAKDIYGRLISRPLVEKFFKVTEDAQVLRVYNYPNPVSSEGTYFTFELTQIPDEVIIRVYTISGRLLKLLKILGSELKMNFNKVFWDCKDEDGDDLANGVYIYKLSMRKGNKIQSSTQKLAILK
jgi:hypothetical protein